MVAAGCSLVSHLVDLFDCMASTHAKRLSGNPVGGANIKA